MHYQIQNFFHNLINVAQEHSRHVCQLITLLLSQLLSLLLKKFAYGIEY